MKDIEHRRQGRGQTVTIEESEVIFVISRAIAKFDAVFGDQKTPQMVSFRICANWKLKSSLQHLCTALVSYQKRLSQSAMKTLDL